MLGKNSGGQTITKPEHAFVDLGPLSDFPENEFRILDIGKFGLGVLRSSNGQVYAVANFCPHRGAPLCEGTHGGTLIPSDPGELRHGLEGAVVRCPWHGYEFSLEDGACLFTGLRMRAKVYPVEIRDGRIHVGGLKTETAS